jgi:hypothetical protein
MPNFEIEGTLQRKLPAQSGRSARGDWAKQEFVLEYPDGNFNSEVCITAWGQDKVSELDRFNEGDRLKVSFNIRAREYNGRWYNDLRAWRISPAQPQGQAAQAPAYAAPAPSYNDPAPAAPAPSYEDMPAEDASQSVDDLPF